MTRGMEVTLEPTRCAHRWAGRRSSRVLAHWPTFSRSRSSRRRPFDFLRERRASVAVCRVLRGGHADHAHLCATKGRGWGSVFQKFGDSKAPTPKHFKKPLPALPPPCAGLTAVEGRGLPLTAFPRHAPTPARRPAPACHLQVRSGVLVRGERRERRILNVVTSLPTELRAEESGPREGE